MLATAQSTKHLPVLLVHGLNARDWSLYTSPNWGRIPQRLRDAGFAVYFANQDSWYSIEHNAKQIAAAIFRILKETGAPKLHVVTHSKGGLDARRAIHLPHVAEAVASAVTLATPHHGLNYANLLSRIPFIPRYIVAPFARIWAHAQGDSDPQLMQLLHDMTTRNLKDFDKENPDLPGIEYRSYAFIARRPRIHVSNPASMLLNVFDGRNDGVVPYWSTDQPHRQLIFVIGKQKVTHDEPVDMHKRDIALVTESGQEYDSMPDFIVDLMEELDEIYWQKASVEPGTPTSPDR